MKKNVGIGLIGAGAMGKAHSIAFRSVGSIFRLPLQPRMIAVADATEQIAARAAEDWGYERYSVNWRAVVDDPDVDIVDIALPNVLHREVALAAAAAGKFIYCEKPLAPTTAEAKEMVLAAENAGVGTQVGFNFLKSPVIDLAREIIDRGEIGDIRSFRGIHAEDYMADPQTPWTWRLDPRGGGGAIADLGSHIVSMARYLLGPIVEVCAALDTVVPTRPESLRSTRQKAVEVDDIAKALVRFKRGCLGTVEASWVASGKKMQLEFEVIGSKGALAFTQERLSELQLFQYGDQESRNGFRTIMAGPLHPPYLDFCIAAGHQLGYNDLKTIEVRDVIEAFAGTASRGPDFREGWEIQRVIDAIIGSARSRSWQIVA